MLRILGLPLAQAGSLSVQLLAVVLVILTRPRPKPLLWAFWLSAMVVSCGTSLIALAFFRANATILGTTSRTVSLAVYLVIGETPLDAAVFAATTRGRELIGGEVDKQEGKSKPSDPDGSVADRTHAKAEAVKSKAEFALKQGSVWAAIAAGVFLGAPSPYSLAADAVASGPGLQPCDLPGRWDTDHQLCASA